MFDIGLPRFALKVGENAITEILMSSSAFFPSHLITSLYTGSNGIYKMNKLRDSWMNGLACEGHPKKAQ